MVIMSASTAPLDTSSPVRQRPDVNVIEYNSSHKADVIRLFSEGMNRNAMNDPREHNRIAVDNYIIDSLSTFDDIPRFFGYHNGGRLFVAVTPEGDVVGTLGLVRQDKHVAEQTAELMRIAVNGKHLRMGICRMLLHHAERYSLNALNVHNIYLITGVSFQAAMEVYHKLGFTEIERSDVEFSIPTSASVEPAKYTIAKFWKELPVNRPEST